MCFRDIEAVPEGHILCSEYKQVIPMHSGCFQKQRKTTVLGNQAPALHFPSPSTSSTKPEIVKPHRTEKKEKYRGNEKYLNIFHGRGKIQEEALQLINTLLYLLKHDKTKEKVGKKMYIEGTK